MRSVIRLLINHFWLASFTVISLQAGQLSLDMDEYFREMATDGSAVTHLKAIILKSSRSFGYPEALEAVHKLIQERDRRLPISCAHTLLDLAYAAAVEEEGRTRHYTPPSSGYQRVISFEGVHIAMARAAEILGQSSAGRNHLITASHILEEVWAFVYYKEVGSLGINVSCLV